ncbi:hypothetical protein [Erwinia sp. E_sp_B04_7]|uniref:hypothetical protein n=1 Tax=unclassified Erwinia TaxID=2622719 RepID=UPI0030D27A60
MLILNYALRLAVILPNIFIVFREVMVISVGFIFFIVSLGGEGNLTSTETLKFVGAVFLVFISGAIYASISTILIILSVKNKNSIVMLLLPFLQVAFYFIFMMFESLSIVVQELIIPVAISALSVFIFYGSKRLYRTKT